MRVIYRDRISTQCPKGPTDWSYLGDLGSPQHSAGNLSGLVDALGGGHGEEVTARQAAVQKEVDVHLQALCGRLDVAPAESAQECGQCSEGIGNSS